MAGEKFKIFCKKVWANPVVKCAALTAVVVAGTMIVEQAKSNLGTGIVITVTPQSILPINDSQE